MSRIEIIPLNPKRIIKGKLDRCSHRETEPVITVAGEHVAQLCTICDRQLAPFDLVDRYADPDLSDWMTMESIGGCPWWVWLTCGLMLAGTVAGLIVNWLAYR